MRGCTVLLALAFLCASVVRAAEDHVRVQLHEHVELSEAEEESKIKWGFVLGLSAL